MRALLALLVLGCCRLVVGQEASAAAAAWYIQIWNYGAPGPAAWGAQFPLCTQKPTSRQSPIDISNAVFDDSLVTPQFVTLNGGCFTWTQVNSLDDISIDLTRPGAQCSNLFMNYEGSSWTLTELRFKSPSEHTIAGGHYDAEAQLLHSNQNNKHVAIVSVLLNVHDTPSNRNNSFLDTIWKSGVNAAPPSLTVVTPGVLTDDFSPYTDLLPGSHNHFQYIGSLTEPPCSEDVDWFIFKDVVIISSDDLRMIRSVGGRAKPNYLSASGSNNRPLQSGYASVQPQLVVKYTDGSTQYDPAAAAAAATAAQSVSFVSLASTSNIAIAALVLALLALLLALVGLRSPASTVHKPGPRAERVDIEAPPRQQQQRRKVQQGAKAAGQHQPPQKPPTQQPRHQSQLQPQAQAHKKKVLVLKKRSGDAEVLNPIMHASLARDKEDDDDDDAGLL